MGHAGNHVGNVLCIHASQEIHELFRIATRLLRHQQLVSELGQSASTSRGGLGVSPSCFGVGPCELTRTNWERNTFVPVKQLQPPPIVAAHAGDDEGMEGSGLVKSPDVLLPAGGVAATASQARDPDAREIHRGHE